MLVYNNLSCTHLYRHIESNPIGFDMDIPSGDINMMESRSSSAIDSFTFHSGFAAAPGITEGGDKASEEEQRPAERR